MLELESIAFKNFLSFGEQVTTLQLSGRGPCLIRGEIEGEPDASNGAGKCLDGDTLVLMVDGRRVRIADLGGYLGSQLVAIDGDYHNSTTTLLRHTCTGRKECFRLTTQSGRQIICSGDHRFLSFDHGWLPLSALTSDLYIAVNRSHSLSPTKAPKITLQELELIGLLLGDGCFTKTPQICISDDEPEIMSRVLELLSSISPDLRLTTSPSSGKRKGKNYRIVINEAHPGSRRRPNPVSRLIRRLGLIGKTKEQKFIPTAILDMPREFWKALIIGFWQADGWLSLGRQTGNRRQRIEIACCNKSENIVRQLQHLLLRLNIRSKVRFRMALESRTGKRHSSWGLIVDTASQLTFLNEFGAELKRAGCPVDEARGIRTDIKRQLFASSNIDLIPANVWTGIMPRIRGGEWRKSAPKGLARSRSMYRQGRHATSREIVAHFGEFLADKELLKLGNSDVVWDKVKSIAPCGLRDTYDIEVSSSGHEPNFSANDIITHNSSIANTILWVLFGRTMHSANPGDRVINWSTGKDCWAQLKFKNGDSITRTRNTSGVNELSYVRLGDEHQSIADSLATLKHQQAELNRRFQLDWELLCGSAFFTQYNRPWLEMADQVRKKAIERALHVDRFNYYSNTAKDKYEACERETERDRARIESHKQAIDVLEKNINDLRTAAAHYEDQKSARLAGLRARLEREQASCNDVVLPNIDDLTAKWKVVDQINTKLAGYQVEIRELDRRIDRENNQIADINRFANVWKAKAGKICSECEREVPASHTEEKANSRLAAKETHEKAIGELSARRADLQAMANRVAAVVAEKRPKMSLAEAQEVHRRQKRRHEELVELEKQIVATQAETNPHELAITQTEERISRIQAEIIKIEDGLGEYNTLAKHYYYIQKAYGDRNKIKSTVFAEHIPFVNKRLKHYLEALGLDITIELTDSLGISSNMWGYDFQSGGERKRTDVAFMLAMFDLHETLYGQQCNIMVLDEVDGRMDEKGIGGLIDIVRDDLAGRAETVFVISHRQQMQDVFPSEVLVKRKGRFSYIES